MTTNSASSSGPAGLDGGLTEYGDPGFSRYLRRAFLAAAGYDGEDLDRPVVGIAHTCSDYVPCHRQMPELVDAIGRGVSQAGGLPFAFPVMSLGEILLNPTSMLFRNLAAMELEELIRAQPMDAVVLVGGCDKTVPAHLMAAASAGVPALVEVAGPMLTGAWRGQRLGACTDCRRFWAGHRAGELDTEEIAEVGEALCPTAGTCMVMGTASTMACLVEALGLMLPGGTTPPAPSGARLRHGLASGRRAVELALAGAPAPADVLTRAAFLNALTVLVAVGGSTNGVIHLLAVAHRVGVELTLDDLAEVAERVPLLVDLKPTGEGYLEDLDRAGGLPLVLKALEPLLDRSTVGVAGRALGALLDEPPSPAAWQGIVHTLDDPLGPPGSLAVVRGTLAPGGALVKAAAATPELLRHRGPALVFDSPADLAARIDDPNLETTPDSVLVLRGAGPLAAGMPEAGALPIPRRLAAAGVRDMVRISDARMSGTAYGTIVLHCSPESAAGGPLALVRDGDWIELDVRDGRLDLLVDEAELERRRGELPPLLQPARRGWLRVHQEHVLPSHLGADLDLLGADRSPPPPGLAGIDGDEDR